MYNKDMKSVQEVLSEYPAEPRERARVTLLQKNADKIFPWLDSLEDPERLQALNVHLTGRGHPELTLREPATMPPLEFVPNPANESQLGLFGAAFVMTDFDAESERRVPVQTPSLLESMYGSIGIPFLSGAFKDHRSRPCFYRAICMDTGLIVNLATDISSQERPLQIYGPEIFVAYRIMSRLVDRRDPGAVKPNGKNNRDYLLKRHVSRVQEANRMAS